MASPDGRICGGHHEGKIPEGGLNRNLTIERSVRFCCFRDFLYGK